MFFAGQAGILAFILSLLLPAMPAKGASNKCNVGSIIGKEQTSKVEENESLWEIARKFDVGINEISDANPGIDPIIPEPGTTVRIPTRWILPDVPDRSGIVINIPEFRLYYFPPDSPGLVLTYPVGVGDEGKDTPLGVYTIVEKIANPDWNVPESIRREKPELPKVVPYGPDNPMGNYALRLSLPAILIHGTDRPWGIGTRSSHGCLRLYPEDIEHLFNLVDNDTKVTIVNQPVKVAACNGKIYIEVHRYGDIDYKGMALQLLGRKGLSKRVDLIALKRELNDKTGIPVDITQY
jgi:L,D-transpeptidase ErfK/SrfK